MKGHSDEWLLAELKSPFSERRNRALEKIYIQYFPSISKLITSNNGNTNQAADIFQDAIIVFYEKVRLNKLQLTCSIQTYLYSIARNLWLNELRLKKRVGALTEDLESIPIEEESFSVLVKQEKKEMVARLLARMNEGCREILSLYYFERLRMKEIAARLGLANEQGAKNKKSRCLKKLKELAEKFL